MVVKIFLKKYIYHFITVRELVDKIITENSEDW